MVVSPRELAFLGDGWTPQVRDRRLSDSMLSVRPKEDEVCRTQLTQQEHQVSFWKKGWKF